MAEFKEEECSFSVLWSIENIACNPFRTNEMLSSPSFKIESLGATEWRLVLFPRGYNNTEYMSLYLHRQLGCPDLSRISVNLMLSVDSELYLPIVARNVRFRENDQWGFRQFLRISDMPLVTSTSLTGSLTVRCQLWVCEDDDEDIAKGAALDLRTLSSDLRLLFDSQRLADVVLRCGKTEFKCHKAVLVARAPKFHRALKFDGDVANASFVSSRVLRALLYYFYSGELDLPGCGIPREILIFAEQFELPDLVKKLRRFPDVCFAKTVLNSEHKSVLWAIDRTCQTESDDACVCFIPTPSLYVDHLVISCQIGNDPYSRKRIYATFRFPDLKVNVPIYLRCKILGIETGVAPWEFIEQEHVFQSKEEWCLITPFQTDTVTHLCFHLSLCDGLSSSSILSDWYGTNPGPSAYHDFTSLSHDFERLQNDSELSDLLVVCPGHIFQANKVILSARSPVFEKMFEHNLIENQFGVVRVPDVRPEVMQLLLSYIYSGKVGDSMTCDDMCDLYEAADKYGIIVLKQKCAALLLDVTTDRNADRLLSLADLHFDFGLKDRIIKKIIALTLEQILVKVGCASIV